MSIKEQSTGMQKAGKTALMPKLRFPEFRGTWRNEPLETLGYFTGGGTPSKDNAAYWTGDIPWISSSDLNEDSIHQVNVSRFITKQAVEESATKLVPAKSILLISRVGVGKLALSTFPLCTSQDFTNFTPTAGDPLFLAYLLKSQREILLSFNQGTSIKGFTKDDIATLRLGFPSLPEQQKIADCLTSLDEAITAQARKVDALKKHKKGLMQELFPREGETQPLRRFPEFQNAGEWAGDTLGNVCQLYQPVTLSTSELSMTGEYLVYGANGIIGTHNEYNHEDSEVAVTCRGATCGEVTMTAPKSWITGNAMVVKPKTKKLRKDFVFQYFKNHGLKTVISGSAQPQITRAGFAPLVIFYPPPGEQQRIGACLSSLDDLTTAEMQKLEALKRHKHGLMQKLFPAVEEADG